MPENDYTGRILDKRYKVSRRLGDSGMGVVYLGEDIKNGAWVSVKFLKPELVQQKESLKRFFREARATAQLRHENIIKTYDIGVTDEKEPFLVMEYIEGESLCELLSRVKKLEPAASFAIIEPILHAVGAMHKKGILHRDIKPENIYLIHRQGSPPKVKLTDFGLAKMQGGGDLTLAGISLGDFLYISPEQIKDSSSVDHRADIYSIGTIMYEMLTGNLPFYEHPQENRLSAKFTSAPTPPRKVVPSIPPVLESLIMKALKMDASERPMSADEMLCEIEGIKGYKDRADKLGKAAEGPRRLTVAGGNFEIPSTIRKASKAKRAEADTDTDTEKKKKKSFKQIQRWLLGTMYGRIVLGAAVFAIVDIILLATLSGDDPAVVVPVAKPSQQATAPSSPEPPPKAPVDEKSNEVQIEIRGVPSGAKIYYDDAPIPLNPFRVALKEVIVPLKIEAEGYEPYATSVVPAEDQVVKVAMKKVEPAAAPATEKEEDVSVEMPGENAEPEQAAPHAKPSGGVASSGKKREQPSRGETSKGKRKNKRGKKLKLKSGVKVSDEFD